MALELELCWRTARCSAAKRLAPKLVVLVPMLRRYGEVDLTDEQITLLVGMSAATIDRRLQGAEVWPDSPAGPTPSRDRCRRHESRSIRGRSGTTPSHPSCPKLGPPCSPELAFDVAHGSSAVL